MRNLILAACLAAPLLMLQPQKATAQCPCDRCDLARWLRNRLCACMQAKHHGPGFQGCGCYEGNCGHSGGCGCGLFGIFGCNSAVPGPWYLYFPYNGRTQEIAGYGPAWPGGWNYEYHFRAPAPVGDWSPNLTPIASAPPPEYSLPPPPGAAPLPPGPPEAALSAPPGVRIISDQ